MEILGVIIDYSYVVMRVNGTCLNPESREVIESLINADRLDVKQFRQGIWEFSAKTQHFTATEGHKIRGHSTTTWTKFYPILTTYPPQVDNHVRYYTTYKAMAKTKTKRGVSTDHLPTCPCSYWKPQMINNFNLLQVSE